MIAPLFLDDLKAELKQLESETNSIKAAKMPASMAKKLEAFQNKLASLTFLENCTTSLIRIQTA